MKKENRIKKRKEFNYIFKNGEHFSSKFITLLLTKSKLKKFKVGFSVSKKVGKAVVRNKVKRRIKEAVYQNRELLQTKTNYLFVARSSCYEANFVEICENVKYLLNKVNSKENNENNN